MIHYARPLGVRLREDFFLLRREMSCAPVSGHRLSPRRRGVSNGAHPLQPVTISYGGASGKGGADRADLPMRLASTLPGISVDQWDCVLAWLERPVHRRHLREVPRALPRRAPPNPPAPESRSEEPRCGSSDDGVTSPPPRRLRVGGAPPGPPPRRPHNLPPLRPRLPVCPCLARPTCHGYAGSSVWSDFPREWRNWQTRWT
jgi:hypothetical protein